MTLVDLSTAHYPLFTPTKQTTATMLLIKTVALLCSATAVMAASAVVSGAIFVGQDTTDYDASPVEIFKNAENHAAAAASVLVFAAKAADFSPATQEPKSLVQNFDAFVRKASTFPGFQGQAEQSQPFNLNGSLIQFEDAIRKATNNPLIARSFRDLVPGYIQDPSLTSWILNLVVLTKPEDSDTVTFNLARMHLTIHSDNNRSAYIPEQQSVVTLGWHSINASYLSAYADKLGELIKTVNVDYFMDYFTSPKVPSEDEQIQSSSTSCSQNRPIFKNRQTIMSWLL